MNRKLTFDRRILALFAVVLAFASSACCAAPGDAGYVTDVVVGHNTKGPYPLSWTNVDPASITVVINGRTLRNRSDYNVDLEKGVIGFNSSLVTDSIVRVSYRTVPGKSQRAAGKMNIPISLNLFQGQGAAIKLMGLYAQDDPNNPDAGKSVFGLGADKKWAATTLNSMLLLSQRNDAGAQSVPLWDRSAVKFGGDTTLGALKLGGSYMHSGDVFAGGTEYGVGVGKNVTDLSAGFAPSKTFQASAKFQENEDTAGKTKGKYSLLSEQSIVYSPLSATRLTLTRSLTESRTAAAGSEKSADSNLIRLDQSFGGNTAAVATFENATLTAGEKTDEVTRRGLQITTDAIHNISLRAMLAQRESTLRGEEQAMSFGIAAKPVQQVAVDVGVGTLENQIVGEQLSTDVKVTASPVKNVAFQAALSNVDSTKLGETTKTNLRVQASPFKNLQFQGALIGDAVNDQERFQRDFSLSGAPTRYSKLTAMLSQRGLNDRDDVTKGATLQLMPLAWTQFTAGYNYTENGPIVMTIRDYAASIKPELPFSFIGSYRDRELNNATALDTTALVLAFAPRSWLSLTGDYQSNPEDKKGLVQPYTTTTLGMTARIGSVGVRTDYTAKDERQVSKLSDEKGVSLEMPAFGHGQLSTGVRIARILQGSELTSRIYSLGYRHAVGQDFSLSLTGCYTQHLRDSVWLSEQTEYNAEANLGYKF